MRQIYKVSLIFSIIFFYSSFLFPQEKSFPLVNDIKFFDGQWYCENFNNVNGYDHPNGKSPFLPTDEFNTTTFSSSNTVVIPNLVSTVSDSILVSGVDSWLYDLNLQTLITHSYCSDLDITLRSPSGKVVTMSSDNGTNNQDVFNGTIWDDQANPGGEVPYSNNSGLVTDHSYTNQTTASPLVPEESFSLFIGENPNGWWLLTISDDQNDDGGFISGWSIEVTTSSIVPTLLTSTFINNVELQIPTIVSVDSVMINVSGLADYLIDVDLTTWLRHSYAADLDITLKSPSGTIATLTTDNGSGNNDVFKGTFWDDQANPVGQVPYTNNSGLVTDHSYFNLVTATPLASEESFAAFLGEDPNGTWVLTISDDAGGDGGTLDSVYLHITTSPDILAVELSSFSYQIVDGGVNLNWVTSSELNNRGFEVQRTTGNNNWEVLGFVEGKGTIAKTSLYSFVDKNLTNNTTYSYRLNQIDFDGTFEYSKIIEVNFQTVLLYNLSQNFPNPFNPSTKITFTIPETGNVKLSIHNIIGEVVSTLVDKKMEAGAHSILFDASSLPSSIYIYQMEVNDFISTKKMMLVK